MRSIREVAGRELLWVQPKNGLAFELRAGDEVIGALAWQRTSLAIGETGDGQWSFKRDGVWHPRVTVRVPGSDDNVALFHPSWTGGGSLELGAEKVFRLGAANFWRPQWTWIEQSGQSLAHLKNHGKGFRLECEVVIENQASAPPEVPLLIVLGWYLLVLSSLDADGGGA